MVKNLKDSEEYNLHIQNMEMYACGAKDKDMPFFQFLYENVGLEADIANELISNWTPPENHTSPAKFESNTTQTGNINLQLELNNTNAWDKIGYFISALIWNIAIVSVACFLAAWGLDIFGSLIESEIIRGFAYVFALLATVSMFWFGLLAAILSGFITCKKCGSRIMTLNPSFFVPLIKCNCVNCENKNG